MTEFSLNPRESSDRQIFQIRWKLSGELLRETESGRVARGARGAGGGGGG